MTEDELHNADSEDVHYWLLAVEKSFQFTFEKDELAGITTFGELADHVANKFNLVDARDCTTQQAFYRLRVAMTSVLEVDDVTPHTLLADILPRKNRIRNAKQLERAVGINLRLLDPPIIVGLGLFALLVASLFGFRINFQVGMLGLLTSCMGFVLAAKLGKELTVTTVGELAKRITREHYVQARRDATTFNRKEIEALLADWLCDDLLLAKSKLTRESTFLKS